MVLVLRHVEIIVEGEFNGWAHDAGTSGTDTMQFVSDRFDMVE